MTIEDPEQTTLRPLIIIIINISIIIINIIITINIVVINIVVISIVIVIVIVISIIVVIIVVIISRWLHIEYYTDPVLIIPPEQSLMCISSIPLDDSDGLQAFSTLLQPRQSRVNRVNINIRQLVLGFGGWT